MKKRLTRGEKILYFFGFSAAIIAVAFKIFGGASIGHYSISVEILKKRITDEEKAKESLVMQVNELTSFDNVKKVIDEIGLSYQNENIIVINR